MFKSRMLNIDGVGKRPQSIKPQSGRSSDGAIRVRTAPQGYQTSRRPVPEEYRTFDHGRRGGWGFLVFLFILFAASVAGFFYWNNRPASFQGDSVFLTATVEEAITSGDEVTYRVEYENQDFVTLKTVSLDVQWPEGFYYNSASQEPTSETATTWVLGPLDPGQKKELQIKGQLVGLKDQTQKAIFRLSYRPENINSDFEVVHAVETRISDARINVELSAPTKVLAGQEVVFQAVISNLTTEKLQNIDVEIVLPKDFEALAYDPVLTDNHFRGDLGLDSPLTITISAKVASDAEGQQAWTVEINEVLGGEPRRLLRKELAVVPVRPEFDVELKINGESNDFEVDYGETLNYQLKITNRSSDAITDMRVTALLDSDVIDRKTVQSNGHVDKDTITWTKSDLEQLGALQPDAEIIIPWKATLLEQGTVGRATVDTLVTLEVEGLPGWKKTSPVFVISVGEGLVFNQGVYWDLGGAQVGRGNLPPVTNERSEYLVIWSLDSGSQDYDAVNISTFLPPKVTFLSADEVDEGALKYDESTQRLEWQINNFSSKLLPLKAAFYIKFVPTDEDEGTVMTLMNPVSIVASGTEIFETKTFSVNTQQVITAREGDVGTVIE
ncbi:MAG: hypothetical protein AAB490_01655 [Patescibacteria group bacterium]